jgi:hypothetical protein
MSKSLWNSIIMTDNYILWTSNNCHKICLIPNYIRDGTCMNWDGYGGGGGGGVRNRKKNILTSTLGRVRGSEGNKEPRRNILISTLVEGAEGNKDLRNILISTQDFINTYNDKRWNSNYMHWFKSGGNVEFDFIFNYLHFMSYPLYILLD